MGTVFCLMFRESLEYPLLFQGMRPLARKKPSTENKLKLLAWAARLVSHRRLNLQALSQVSLHDALESGKGKRDQGRSRASPGDCCAHPGPVPSPVDFESSKGVSHLGIAEWEQRVPTGSTSHFNPLVEVPASLIISPSSYTLLLSWILITTNTQGVHLLVRCLYAACSSSQTSTDFHGTKGPSL